MPITVGVLGAFSVSGQGGTVDLPGRRQRWRVRRWWVSGVLVAGVLCLEPLARLATGELFPPADVWAVEVVLGVIVTALFAYTLMAWRHRYREEA